MATLDCKLSTFPALLLVILLAVLSNTDAASTRNGKLLKFYPITNEQYKDILALIKQQPAVFESHVMESHRSLADWSNTLHTSWNTLFNGTGRENKTSGQKLSSYPMCVIKTQNPVRHKRGASQYPYNADYAGLAPNVVYQESSYYGRPLYHGRSHYRSQYQQPSYEGENNDDEVNNENNEPADNVAEPEPVDIQTIDENNNEPEKDLNTPIINCVVVIRRKNQIIRRPPNPDADDTNDVDEYSPPSYGYPHYPHYPYPPHKQPPPYAYPLPIPAHGQYPYPQPHPYGSSTSYGQPSSSSNEHPVMDHTAVVQYQEIIAEYYKHLHALYMADANTGIPRSENQPDYVDDDVEGSSIEESDKENIQTRGSGKDDNDKKYI